MTAQQINNPRLTGVDIKRLRCARGWTQTKLAALTGIARPVLSEVEASEKIPAHVEVKLLRALYPNP